MYSRFFFLGCCLLLMTHAAAQSLTARSNELSMSIKDGALKDCAPLPQIKWITPKLEFTSSAQNKIEINAQVKSSSALKEINLLISNAKDGAIIGKKKMDLASEKKEYSLTTSITLPDGTSKLALEAITMDGITVSESRLVLTGKDAGDVMVSLDRKDYVLLFATDKYDHWDDLVNPVDDAHAIAQELKDKFGFVVDLVENPTDDQIWEKLREYNERRFSPQDQLLIFFAGHGHYDESFGEGFVVAKNSLSNDKSRTTYLSHNRLRGVINNIPCNHILLTMDVCFGGTLDPVIARSRGAADVEVSVNQMLIRKWSHRTRKYLTSGGKEYVSDGIVGKHSPFAGKLIESLRSMGGDDRILTLTEIQANLEKLKQQPRFGSFGEDEALSDFVFVGK
ncbi:MAG: hypothetical protein DI538_07700 [Azospira oryzae]|jgi:hypothetical protein|nr:MAG: hypothetical protein DI538_07700 [Azospira oryzae]